MRIENPLEEIVESESSSIAIGVFDKETELLDAPNRRVTSWKYFNSCGKYSSVFHAKAMKLSLARTCPSCGKNKAEIILPDLGYYEDYIKVKTTRVVTMIS